MTAGDSTIRAAISELAWEDAAVAADAEAALEWLTAGAGAVVLTQEHLQTFLWYGLPMKWLTDGSIIDVSSTRNSTTPRGVGAP